MSLGIIRWWIVKNLVRMYPNDQQLGREVRKFVGSGTVKSKGNEENRNR